MNYSFLTLLNEIKAHGSFSFPFINFCLEQNISKCERAFILVLKNQLLFENLKALDEVKEGLKYCSDKNIVYLFLMKKLELLRRLGRSKRAEQVYKHLRKDISDVSPSIREFFLAELSGHRALDGEKEVICKINLDSDYMSKSAKAYIEMNMGRGLVKNGSIEEGLIHFERAYKLAKEAKHPSAMIDALNLLAWYGIKYDLDDATNYAKEALYNAGYFFEMINPAIFDTTIEVMKSTNDLSLFEVSRDFLQMYDKLPTEFRRKYKKRFTQAKRMLSTTFYKSDGKTRRLLRRMNKQKSLGKVDISYQEIFNLLHSKVKSIRGETIRKIISKNPEFFKEIELSKLPKGFACEIAKKKIGLQDGIESIINVQKSLDPFIQARKDLVVKYLERMPKRIRERFIQRYLTLDDEEKEIIDRFARDYVRYDIRWGMRVKMPDEMEKYTKSFHLKKIPTALAYFALDDEKERKRLVNTLEKLK